MTPRCIKCISVFTDRDQNVSKHSSCDKLPSTIFKMTLNYEKYLHRYEHFKLKE